MTDIVNPPTDLGSGRALCPSDTCVGVLDPAGRCPECGATGEPAGYDARELCGDGSCIGIIGEDGRCSVCGSGSPQTRLDPRRRGKVTAPPDDDGPVDMEGRTLCPDGACIGIVDNEGQCKVCGLKIEANTSYSQRG